MAIPTPGESHRGELCLTGGRREWRQFHRRLYDTSKVSRRSRKVTKVAHAANIGGTLYLAL